MGHSVKRDFSDADIQDRARELKKVNELIKQFRVEVDGDERALLELKQKWRDLVLEINVMVQGIRQRKELSNA